MLQFNHLCHKTYPDSPNGVWIDSWLFLFYQRTPLSLSTKLEFNQIKLREGMVEKAKSQLEAIDVVQLWGKKG